MNWSKGKRMPDISKCQGTGCPLKNECYRYRAAPYKFMQSYLSEPPYKDGKCPYFIDAKGWRSLRTLEECEKDE